MSKPEAYDIYFDNNGKVYHTFTLRNKPDELFFHFCYSSEKRIFKDIINDEMTRRSDHFSWHADGNGHLKIDSANKPIKGSFPDGTFIPKVPNSISPLFIISYFSKKGLWQAKAIDSTTTQKDLSYVIPVSSEKFSLIGFLVPSLMPVTHFENFEVIVNNPKQDNPIKVLFSDLFAAPISLIRLPLYNNFDVLILLSDLAEEESTLFSEEPHLYPYFVDIDKTIGKLLYCSKVNDMRSLN